MYINLDPGSVGIDLPLNDVISLAARHGYGGLDLPLSEAAALSDLDAVGARMREAQLRFGGINLPVDFRRDQDTYDRDLARIEEWLPVAGHLGCDRTYTWVGPGHNERDYAANFGFHVTRLRPVADLLARHGMRLGLEFIGPKTLRDTFRHEFVHTIPQMLELCDAVQGRDSSHVGVLLDSYHWYLSSGVKADLLDNLNNRNIVYVHLNDAVAGRSREEQMDLERELPCASGLIDANAFVSALNTVGYDGPVTVEPFSEALNQLPADEIAAQTIAAARKMLASG